MEGTTWAMPARSGRQLAEEILAGSRQAGLGPGSRLPTERQLAVDLGVTRSGIRQALGVLEADGLITREVGRGTFFSESARQAFDGGASAGSGPGREAPERSVPATDFAPAD